MDARAAIGDLGRVAVAVLVGLSATLAVAEGPNPPSVDQEREAVRRWIQTQKLIYQERRDWLTQKEILESRIELIRKEIGELEAKLATSRQAASESDSKTTQARVTRQELADEGTRMGRVLVEFETAVRAMHPWLPPAVQERVQPLFQRVPTDPASTRVSVAERLQNVVGILNEVNKANGEITLATEVRTLSDGKPSEVKIVYLGLAQAYYISAKGEAGVGHPTADGWTWSASADLAPRVVELIEILEGKAQPKFVPLPVKVS